MGKLVKCYNSKKVKKIFKKITQTFSTKRRLQFWGSLPKIIYVCHKSQQLIYLQWTYKLVKVFISTRPT